jgi:hypothetical protein
MRVAALTPEARQCRSCRWRRSVRLEEQSDGRAKRKRREGGLHLGVAATRDKDRATYVADDRSGIRAAGGWPSAV